MTKQKFEEKKVITICGILSRNDEGEYIVAVEDKNDVKIYPLDDILKSMEDSIISLTSDIY